jgi:hypothetical protein
MSFAFFFALSGAAQHTIPSQDGDFIERNQARVRAPSLVEG